MTAYRIMVDKKGLYSVEERFLWGLVWWTRFQTYSSRGATAYTAVSGAEYNEKTDLFEVRA